MNKENKYRLITLLNLDSIQKMFKVLPETDNLEKAAAEIGVDASGLSKYIKELETMGVIVVTPRKEAREAAVPKYSVDPAFIGIALGFCNRLWIAGHPTNEKVDCGPSDLKIETSEGPFYFWEKALEYAFRVIRVYETKSRLYALRMCVHGHEGKYIQEQTAKTFDLSESSVRDYLRDLEELELVVSAQKGKTKKYAPNVGVTEEIEKLMVF